MTVNINSKACVFQTNPKNSGIQTRIPWASDDVRAQKMDVISIVMPKFDQTELLKAQISRNPRVFDTNGCLMLL